MIISNTLHPAVKTDEVEFASIVKHPDGNIVINTLNRAYKCEYNDNDKISLKDVKYAIKDGVLYIEGIRLSFTHIGEYTDFVNYFGDKCIRKVSQDINWGVFENPPLVKTVKAKRLLFWGYKTFKNCIELNDNDSRWFKLKAEKPFYMAASNFRLYENEK
jgi:hypothetical protein